MHEMRRRNRTRPGDDTVLMRSHTSAHVIYLRSIRLRTKRLSNGYTEQHTEVTSQYYLTFTINYIL